MATHETSPHPSQHSVWGDETEVVRLALDWAARRVVRPIDPKTTAHPAAELRAAAGRTITRPGSGGPRRCGSSPRFEPATRAQDDPMNLAYVPSAPTGPPSPSNW